MRCSRSSGRNGVMALLLCGCALACELDSECASKKCLVGWGILSGECAKVSATLAGGAVCTVDSECATGKCLDNWSADTCAFKKNSLEAGTVCSLNNECKSGTCIIGSFANACANYPGTAQKGETCSENKECASNNCFQVTILKKECTSSTKYAGSEQCYADSECASNRCSKSIAFGNKCLHESGKGADGKSCRNGFECKSYYCEMLFVEGTCKTLGSTTQIQAMKSDAGLDDTKKRCSAHSACNSKACIWPYGGVFSWASEGYCALKAGTLAMGAECSMDAECRSVDCRYEYLSSVCAPDKKSLPSGATCYSSKDCASNACLGWSQMTLALSPGKCGMTNLVAGSACTYNSQCSTKFCSQDKCVLNGTAAPGADCGTHLECSSGYCVGGWNPVGGKCDSSDKNLVEGKPCYQDGACSSGVCETVLFQEQGQCGAPPNSVKLHKPCALDKNCLSRFCIKGHMTFVTGQICGAPRMTLPNGTSCKVDEECQEGYLCNGKYLGTGKCLHIDSLNDKNCADCSSIGWNKQITLPQNMLSSDNAAVVKKFVLLWKKEVGNWTDLGVVDSWMGKKDLINDELELWIYEHLTMVVVSIVSEMFGAVKAQIFSEHMDMKVEGDLNVGDTTFKISNGTKSIFDGASDVMAWVDDLMDDEDEQWFENVTIKSSQKAGWAENLLPAVTIKKMMRQSLGMGVAFLESSMKTAEARIFGRWMKNIVNVTQSRRLSASVEAAVWKSSGNATAKVQAQDEQSSVQKNFRPRNDVFVKEFTNKWFTKYGRLAGAPGAAAFGMLGGMKVEVLNQDWEKQLFQNMIGMMMMAVHDALGVGLEVPFIFDEHIRLQRVDLDRQVQETQQAAGRRLADERQLLCGGGISCGKWGPHEKPEQGYGAAEQYKNSKVNPNAVSAFIEDFKTTFPKIADDGNLGLLKACNPFNTSAPCVMVDTFDDTTFMERFANIAVTFFGSALKNSELRLFHQRFYMVLKGLINPSTTSCIKIVTGPAKHNDGTVTVHVDTGNGFVSVASGKHAIGATVVSKCFDKQVKAVQVSSPTTNAWTGSIQFSADAGKTYKFMECKDCTSGLIANSIVVDGNADSHNQGSTQCFNGAKCVLLPASSQQFSTYLQKRKSKLPLETLKKWVEARYGNMLGSKVAEIESALSVNIADKTTKVIPAAELKKFCVKSLMQSFMYLEMAMLDIKLDILGVAYELTVTTQAVDNILAQSVATKLDIDWGFVNSFVENWYTQHQYEATSTTDIELTSFFTVHVGILPELEKMMCKIAFGAAMDVLNANFQKMDLPLPLIDQAITFVSIHPEASSQLMVPKTKVQGATTLKAGKFVESLVPTLNAAVPTVLKYVDPIRTLHLTEYKPVKLFIESINGESTCDYKLNEMVGLSSQRFKDVSVDADFPSGCGAACKVCTVGKACGDLCVAKNSTATCSAGCAVDAATMSFDVELTGRRLLNKRLDFFCQVCTKGKPCGNACIQKADKCNLAPGCAVAAADTVCKVCTGGRKKCGDKCIDPTAECDTATGGCARDAAEIEDLDLTKFMTSKGKLSLEATQEISLKAKCTCKIDFCNGQNVSKTTGCCPGEEKFKGRCYASCKARSLGKRTERVDACTCRLPKTTYGNCASDEEEYEQKCFKKCSILSEGSHPVRSGPNTCRRVKECENNEEKYNGVCMKKCGLLAGATHSVRSGEYTCRKTKKCEDDEEIFQGKCYKKCSGLTGGSHKIRHAPNVCKKADKCASNEEEFEGKCFKKCSILTNNERKFRLGPYTCSPSPDEIDARLKRARGGDGEIRASLAWDNKDDLDIYMTPPGCSSIYYGRTRHCGGHLDVDANANRRGSTSTPLENIYWPPLAANSQGPPRGLYKVWLQVYRRATWRTTKWQAKLKVGGKSRTFSGTIPYSKKRRGYKVYLGTVDPNWKFEYIGPAASPPIWESESSGSGCSGYGVAGDGTCAKPLYHLWSSGTASDCSGFSMASDRTCPKTFFHPITMGTNCTGYGIASDGGCANLPYDPWKKGQGCSGFGIVGTVVPNPMGDKCPVAFGHPWSSCEEFGVAANLGIAHFPHIDPLTIPTRTALKGFKAAARYETTLNPTTLSIASLTLDKYTATWDDVEFKLPELGVFSVQEEAIHTALSTSFEKHFENQVKGIIQHEFNKLLTQTAKTVNSRTNFTRCLSPASTAGLVNSLGRRLTHDDIHPGHTYTMSADGRVEPKVEEVCDNSMEEPVVEAKARSLATAVTPKEGTYLGLNATELPVTMVSDSTSGYPSVGEKANRAAIGGEVSVVSDKRESVEVIQNLYGIDFKKLKLSDAMFLAFSEATQKSIAKYAEVPVSDVVSLPEEGRTCGTTRLIVQIFVASSKKTALLAKVTKANAKYLENAITSSIKALDLKAATTRSDVLVSTEKIVAGAATITFTQVADRNNCPAGTQTTAPLKPGTKAPTKKAPTNAPAPSSGTGKGSKTAHVSVTVYMKGLDFVKVIKNVATKNALIENIKQSYLASLPAGYTKDHILITLSKGSIIAKVDITPSAGSDSATLQSTMATTSSTVTEAVHAKIKEMPALKSGMMLEFGKNAEDFTVTATTPVLVEAVTTTTKKGKTAPGLVADFGIRATLPTLVIALMACFHVAQM